MTTTNNPPPPKRRRYDPYGSLSEYGIFPECDAQPPTEDADAVSAYDLAVLDDAAETLDRLGDGSTGLRAARARIASALSQPAEAQGVVDVRKLVALAEQWERDAAGCRRDGYIDAAVVKEDCAQSIRQTLGISAIAKALATKQPAAVDVVQVPRELINDLLAALQGRRGDLHFRLAVLAAQQQEGE